MGGKGWLFTGIMIHRTEKFFYWKTTNTAIIILGFLGFTFFHLHIYICIQKKERDIKNMEN
jgi:hypothetical protein